MPERIHVAVGVIYNASRDKVLISRRRNSQHLAGLWEFPGGKLKKNEDVRTALSRELKEELGIVVEQANRLKIIKHDYSDKKVLLDVWSINEWTEKVTAREKQEIAWASISGLYDYAFPEANKSIISLINLPSIYLVSRDNYKNKKQFLSFLEECFSAGLKLFQLRLKPLEVEDYSALVKEIKYLSKQYSVNFILNGTAKDISSYDVDGVHLNSREIFAYSKRPINNNYLLGASCHNEKELFQANKIDVDYVFISPVKQTNSHITQQPLGWKNFYDLCNKSTAPVFALGGLQLEDKKQAVLNGAHGIAMISAIWDLHNPAEVMKYLN